MKEKSNIEAKDINRKIKKTKDSKKIKEPLMKVKETLISDLVNKFDDYMSNFIHQKKINSIFSEFDNKARKDLMSLIKYSSERYKLVKSGNTIKSVLNKQKENFGELLDMVTEDNFYISPVILEERKKIYNYPTMINLSKKNIEIREVRNKIKDENIENMEDKDENDYRENKKKRLSVIPKIESKTYNARSALRKTKLDNHEKTKIAFKSIEPKESTYEKDKHFRQEKNNEFKEFMKKDEDTFMTQINLYKLAINEYYHSSLKDSSQQIQKENTNEDNALIKVNVKPDDLKLINFQRMIEKPSIQQNRQDQYVNIQKLLDFTRSKQNQNKAEREREREEEHKKIKSKTSSKSFFKPNDSTKNKFYNTTTNIQSKKEKYDHLVNDIKSDRNNSTIGFVKQIVSNGFDIEKNFEAKKQIFDDKIIEPYPSKQDIDIKINEKFKKKKDKQNDDNEFLNTKDIDYNKIKQLPIKEQYNELYNKKKLVWQKEDKIIEANEQLELEQRKKTRLLLNQLKKRNRYAHLYIDDYSLRDKQVNKNILDLNKELGKRVMDKKKLNKVVEEFIESLERENSLE